MNKTDAMAKTLLTLTQSEEWFRICDEDAGIREAEDQLQTVLERLELSANAQEQIWERIYFINNACITAAMLYGIRVANAIRDVSAKDITFSTQVLRQSRKMETEVAAQ